MSGLGASVPAFPGPESVGTAPNAPEIEVPGFPHQLAKWSGRSGLDAVQQGLDDRAYFPLPQGPGFPKR